MESIGEIIGDLLNNWDNPHTLGGAAVVAVVGLVIRYFEKRRLIKKLKKD